MKSFSKVHPFVLMFYFVSVIVISMFSGNPLIQLISLMGSILFCFTLTNTKEKLNDIFFYVPLTILISITNPLFSHNGETPLFFMNGNAITLEAIIYGVNISVMIVSVMIWFKTYSMIMTSDKFVFLFGKLIPKTSLILSMALKFIPVLKRQGQKINKSQKALGIYSTESYVDRLLFSMRNISSLISWSMENAVNTSQSMQARGYGLKGHTSYSNYYFRLRDYILLMLCLILFAVVIIGTTMGYISFSFYPYITNLNMSTYAIIIYICFTILALIPFFIEIGENIRWTYYKSKI